MLQPILSYAVTARMITYNKSLGRYRRPRLSLGLTKYLALYLSQYVASLLCHASIIGAAGVVIRTFNWIIHSPSSDNRVMAHIAQAQ